MCMDIVNLRDELNRKKELQAIEFHSDFAKISLNKK